MSEGRKLAPYAARDAHSRGRMHVEPDAPHRGVFQRDRDRIIHCGAFRRLEYKTQVFVNHEGDMFRNRLTHSLEVAQIARTVARALGLNEDLVEAVSLAHDLGHTPFGHAGQHALNDCMRGHGGFEHNLQSLRVVDRLEERYAAFPGLNLSFETREGILKHCAREAAATLGEVGARFLEGHQPGLEAQLVNIADEVAYNNHDVDDGLRSGLLTVDDLLAVGGFADAHREVVRRYPDLGERRVIHEVIRRMINRQVMDLIETSRERIEAARPATIDDVRAHPEALIGFSDEARDRHLELKRFLRRSLYRHYRVHRMTAKAQRVVRELYAVFMEDPALLAPEPRAHAAALEDELGPSGRARGIADYIAGMTDRFAIAEHDRVFAPDQLT